MGYYEEKRQVFNVLEAIIKQNSGKIDKNLLIYDLTKRYKISEKTLIKRLELMKKVDKITEMGGILSWKTAKTSKI